MRPTPGVADVLVTLTRPDGTTITTTTNAVGYYEFTNLIPGDYSIQVTPPAGYRITPVQNAVAGTPATDSDVSPVTGKSATITLVSGQNDPTWDAGLFQPAALGDFVWNDLNANGVQDAGEPAIDGVTVKLYKASDPTTAISTTTTAG